MLLYRYLGSHAFEILKDAELKTSRISTFNDPFEFLFRISNPLTSENAIRRIEAVLERTENNADSKKALIDQFRKSPEKIESFVKGYAKDHEKTMDERGKKLDEIYRVVCFSSSEATQLNELLLWSHYTNKHFGVRIGFEFPESIERFQIIKIKYQDERVEVNMDKIFDPVHVESSMRESFKVKSNAWKYECEYRLLAHPELREERVLEDQKTECFIKFHPKWIKSIDFGVRCLPEKIREITDLVKTKYPHLTCRKAVFHRTDYALEYIPIQT